jgi:hypothetical protein
MTVRGSCLCGGIKFEITGPLSGPLNCHCSQCRTQHGAPFRSRVRVEVKAARRRGFEITDDLPQHAEFAPTT